MAIINPRQKGFCWSLKKRISADLSSLFGLPTGIYKSWRRYGKLTEWYTALYVPYNPQTVPQQSNRSKFALAVSAWEDLTFEQKKVYNERAKNMLMYGRNLFIREYMLSVSYLLTESSDVLCQENNDPLAV
jgi:hypothetical protein